MAQASPGKLDRLHRTPAESTALAFDGTGLCDSLPARPTKDASYSVSVRQVAALLHTSFRRHLAMTPLCFASPSPGRSWDFRRNPYPASSCRSRTRFSDRGPANPIESNRTALELHLEFHRRTHSSAHRRKLRRSIVDPGRRSRGFGGMPGVLGQRYAHDQSRMESGLRTLGPSARNHHRHEEALSYVRQLRQPSRGRASRARCPWDSWSGTPAMRPHP